MQRVLVHGDQREPGVVGLGDRAPGAVFIDIADTEILQIAPVGLAVPVRSDLFCFRDHALPSSRDNQIGW